MTLHRIEREDGVTWIANLNGVQYQYMTADKDLVLHEEGIADGTRVGLRLVDQHGKAVAYSWQPADPLTR